jgi:hypothetical protein
MVKLLHIGMDDVTGLAAVLTGLAMWNLFLTFFCLCLWSKGRTNAAGSNTVGPGVQSVDESQAEARVNTEA